MSTSTTTIVLAILSLQLVALASNSHNVLAAASTVSCGDKTACETGTTCCAAGYSVTGMGCCPYANAVCCPNHQTCCPQGTTCKTSGLYATTCMDSGGSPSKQPVLSVCKPGPGAPPSSTQPNVLVLGDSVSIGYTPHVHTLLQAHADVQHTPYDDTDGGAEYSGYMLQCLDMFLRTPLQDSFPADLIFFNSGLHNLATPASIMPGQSATPAQYYGPLKAVTEQLVALGPHTKLVYATTTPVPYNATQNSIVQNQFNKQARALMEEHGIPVVDLYQAVIDVCGPVPYDDCPISLNKAGHPNPHYTAAGYQMMAEKYIGPAILKALGGSQ